MDTRRPTLTIKKINCHFSHPNKEQSPVRLPSSYSKVVHKKLVHGYLCLLKSCWFGRVEELDSMLRYNLDLGNAFYFCLRCPPKGIRLIIQKEKNIPKTPSFESDIKCGGFPNNMYKNTNYDAKNQHERQNHARTYREVVHCRLLENIFSAQTQMLFL